MAKKKRAKESEKVKFRYSVELTGLVLVLMAILGSKPYGLIGKLIKNFEIFLMGDLYVIVFFLMLFLGLHMVLKRKMPDFFSTKLIGLYIVIIVVLTLAHSSYITTSKLDLKLVIETTISQFMEAVDHYQDTGVGGGMIGAIFSVIFIGLFDTVGSNIVLGILALFGIVLLFDVTMADVWDKIKESFRKRKENKKNKIKVEKVATEEDDDDDKVIISSVEELYTGPKKEIPIPLKETNLDTPLVATSNEEYILPSIELLDRPQQAKRANSIEDLKRSRDIIEKVLADFQITGGKVVSIQEGPAITQFEVEISSGTKLSRVTSIHRELALALAAKEVRIMAPIPGKSTIGIEIPNKSITPVKLREVLGNVPDDMQRSNVLVALGKDIMGNIITTDLTKMPHLLVAGSTGSGKSVCINGFIASIMMRYSPDEVKLVLIDPKQVEMSIYKKIPHLYYPVVTDPKEANQALKRIVVEMDRRYQIFKDSEVRKMDDYNKLVESEHKKNLNSTMQKLPYIIVIIDEFADLMLAAAKEVEDSVMRITQLARAAGIHIIVATQRPSTDVITGTVKSNIGSRIAFAVSSGIDSRTILDATGAEKLLGKGDMLYWPMGESMPLRIQGAFVTDNELKKLVDFVTNQRQIEFTEEQRKELAPTSNATGSGSDDDDPLYNEIVDFAVRNGAVSASLLQRKFKLGFNRAARMIDALEENGIVGAQNGSKPREVLVKLDHPLDED